jgi:hypothetical protein
MLKRLTETYKDRKSLKKRGFIRRQSKYWKRRGRRSNRD